MLVYIIIVIVDIVLLLSRKWLYYYCVCIRLLLIVLLLLLLLFVLFPIVLLCYLDGVIDLPTWPYCDYWFVCWLLTHMCVIDDIWLLLLSVLLLLL